MGAGWRGARRALLAAMQHRNGITIPLTLSLSCKRGEGNTGPPRLSVSDCGCNSLGPLHARNPCLGGRRELI